MASTALLARIPYLTILWMIGTVSLPVLFCFLPRSSARAPGDRENRLREHAPLYPITQPAKNPERLTLISDANRVLGWLSGTANHSGVEATVTVGEKTATVRIDENNSAKSLLITADAGGSNGYRTRLWKVELQNLADEIGLVITVCLFPPGTSKWNKIEHRLFSFISKNWRGQPLDSLATIVNLISHTTTKSGLYVEASLDYASYEKGIEVTDVEMDKLHLKRNKFHGEWNYSLIPR